MKAGQMAILAAVLAIPSAAAAGSSCKRHIYNTSDQPWRYEIKSGGAQIWCAGGMPEGECVVAPKSTIILYVTGHYVIAIKDVKGKVKTFRTETRLGHSCPRVTHDGNTGGTAVNAPADSDFTSNQSTWSGPLLPDIRLPRIPKIP